MQLTPSQEEAVGGRPAANTVVTAGPGSGKTRILVERVRRLIEVHRVDPREILAITFTIKAAHEMYSRLVGAENASEELRRKFENAQIQTIDGFSSSLLRENALTAGVDPEFTVLEPAESEDLLQQTIAAALDDAFARGPQEAEVFLRAFSGSDERADKIEPTKVHRWLSALVNRIRSHGVEPFVKEWLPRLSLDDFAADLRELAALKDDAGLRAAAKALAAVDAADLEAQARILRGIDPGDARAKQARPLVKRIREQWLPDLASELAAEMHEPARRWLFGVTARILDDFEQRKRERGAVDFDDLQRLAIRLLRGESAPALRYKHILIDEYQDTNPLQAKLIEAVIATHGNSPPACFVVGDINQSIYGFRHADPTVFRNYRDRVRKNGGKVVALHENFRSRPEILGAVHRLLPGGADSGVEPHRLQAGREHPAQSAPSVDIQIVSQAGEEAAEWEAGWCAARLMELIAASRNAAFPGSEIEWGDCAILLRTRELTTRFAAELRRRRIPYRLEAGKNFYRTPEVYEAAAFLRMLRNPRDEISLAVVLKSAFVGVEDGTLLALKAADKNLSHALAAVPVAGPDGELLHEFNERLRGYRADRDTTAPDRLLAAAMADCGYDNWLATAGGGEHALANIRKLLRIIRGLAAGGAGFDAVSAALDERLNAAPAENEAEEPKDSRAALELLTMHSAKGMEFPVVVVAGLQHSRAAVEAPLTFSPQRGIGVKWRNPISKGSIGDPAHRAVEQEMRQRDREENERLLYVAATRAERHLILSCSFSAKPQKRGFCKLLFERFGIDHLAVTNERRRIAKGRPAFGLLQTNRPAPPGDAAGPMSAPPPAAILLRPRAAEASADIAISVSSVAAFAQCPRKYFLSRYIGLESTVAPAVSMTAADDAAEPVERDKNAGDAAAFGQAVHEYLAGGAAAAGASAAVRKTAEQFLEHPLGRRAARAERKSFEQSFLFALDDRILRGQIDLLFEEDGRRILVDYKTDRVAKRDIAARARGYEPQVQLYAAALANAGQPVDQAFLLFLREPEAYEVDVGADALARARATAAELFEAQRRREFPLNVGGHCRHCPHYRKACPAELPAKTGAGARPRA